MNILRMLCIFFAIIGSCTVDLFAQKILVDSVVENSSITYAKTVYYDRINVRKTVFIGPEYSVFLGYDKQHYPYFQIDSAGQGSIVYDGLAVAGVRLLYDIQADQLVMQYPESPLRFLLDTARITDFTLGGHVFHRFAADSTRPAGLATGFYDILLPTGPLQVVAKRQKQRQDQVKDRRELPYYLLKDKFYVIEKNQAKPVKTKKDLFRLRPENRKVLVTYLREKKLIFREDKEAWILLGVKYLNTIL
ncbi:hypothetical protein F1C16_09430 [Hymenobacter sp. NBH84]|uniref:hypothetical protein n=1 Tax=Hymenobacter sp. NBH84 TaxID=2596915 RepID=UPI001624B1F2|nr:hypothetical protein [Hymenobacter sp. NBH84]QNE39760.1 hypothetical protein F1C16_09430 [Hymenobacter sp. NBH84]